MKKTKTKISPLCIAGKNGCQVLLVVLLSVLHIASIYSSSPTLPSSASKARPPEWAAPIPGISGLPNLHRVNANLYRCAQPLSEGFVLLAGHQVLAKGDRPIKTVVSLRAFNDDDDLVPTSSGLRMERIKFKSWHPEDEDVVKFLRIATTPAMQPVLVHCQHGADRTGTMIAIYRIACDGWSKKQALDEMVNGGFGFHAVWRNLLEYIEGLDVEAIKAKVAKEGEWK